MIELARLMEEEHRLDVKNEEKYLEEGIVDIVKVEAARKLIPDVLKRYKENYEELFDSENEKSVYKALDRCLNPNFAMSFSNIIKEHLEKYIGLAKAALEPKKEKPGHIRRYAKKFYEYTETERQTIEGLIKDRMSRDVLKLKMGQWNKAKETWQKADQEHREEIIKIIEPYIISFHTIEEDIEEHEAEMEKAGPRGPGHGYG